MAKIDSFNFGFVVVDGKQYVHDVLILPDGTVKEREAGKARLGSHTIAKSEIENPIRAHPDVILVSTGTRTLVGRYEAERSFPSSHCNISANATGIDSRDNDQDRRLNSRNAVSKCHPSSEVVVMWQT